MSGLPSQTRRTLNFFAFDSDVTRVYVQRVYADDELMSRLAELPNLTYLTIFDGSVTDAGLAELAGASSLRSLELLELARMTDAGLARLKPLGLRELTICRTPAIDGSGLSKLTSLTSLTISGCARFDDDSLAQLTELDQLTTLQVVGTGVTNAAMEHLAKFTSLEELDVSSTAIDDTGLSMIIDSCPGLVSISLRDTKITEAGFARLAQLKSLEDVSLTRGTVGTVAIAKLRSSHAGITIQER